MHSCFSQLAMRSLAAVDRPRLSETVALCPSLPVYRVARCPSLPVYRVALCPSLPVYRAALCPSLPVYAGEHDDNSYGSPPNAICFRVISRQAPAVDVVAIGMASGRVVLHNIRYDEQLMSFTQDWGPVTAISFRTGWFVRSYARNMLLALLCVTVRRVHVVEMRKLRWVKDDIRKDDIRKDDIRKDDVRKLNIPVETNV